MPTPPSVGPLYLNRPDEDFVVAGSRRSFLRHAAVTIAGLTLGPRILGSKSKSEQRLESLDKIVALRNRYTEIRLSKTNGCIVGVHDVRTGKVLCSVEDKPGKERLYRIVAMRHRERGRAGDAHNQRDIAWSHDSAGVTITYPALTFEGQAYDCSAMVRIEDNGDGEWRFLLTVENHGNDLIHEIQFPMLPGWHNREGDRIIALTAGAKWKSQVGELPRFGRLVHGGERVTVDYPGPSMYMPWLDFSGPDGGLSMINYMKRPYTGGVGGINLMGYERGSLECYYWRHYPYLKKEGRWSSPPIGVSVHDGDWHHTADLYYEWFKSNVGVQIQQPESLRTAIGFQNIFLRKNDGTRINAVESLPAHARAGRQYGVNHLSVWDSLTLGNYAIFDSEVDLLDYPPDEHGKLQAAIAAAKREGVTVSAQVNFRHINVRSPWYERYKSEAVLCLDGSEWRENLTNSSRTSARPTPHLGGYLILLSPQSPLTRQRIDGLLSKYLKLGYNALFYDQPFLHQLNYNYMGAGSRPDDSSSALLDTIEHVRSRLREVNPNAYTIGEYCDIFNASRGIDLNMEWNFLNGGIEDLARTLYACPHTLLSYVIDYTTSAEAHASHAFAAGLLLCLSIDGNESNLSQRPELAEHIKKLAALRLKCAPRMAKGRFRHTQGLTCKNGAGVVAYGYNSPSGPAVALAAGTTGGTARVKVDLSCFQAGPDVVGGELHLMDGGTISLGKVNQLERSLAPNEVAVWYV